MDVLATVSEVQHAIYVKEDDVDWVSDNSSGTRLATATARAGEESDEIRRCPGTENELDRTRCPR